MLIDGKKIAKAIIAKLKRLRVPNKTLAAILIGESAQSLSFLKQKERVAKILGIQFVLYKFSGRISEQNLIKKIEGINKMKGVGGIILQLPLPNQFNRSIILSAIDPKKDVDALAPESQKFINPLSVEVVRDVLNSAGKNIHNKKIAVIGAGFLIGKPIVGWLEKNNINFELFTRKSDISKLKKFDLIISGVGKNGLIKPAMLRSNAVVIDFGYDSICGKLKGDFDATGDLKKILYTPTPGGTGPVLVAEIFKNFYKLNK